jgi:uncharacterized protein YxjI
VRYILEQKLFSLGNVFYITDDQGREVYEGQGKIFSFGHQLSLRDMGGNELAYIRQKMLSWGPTYEIYRNDQLFAVVKNELFHFFKHVFSVDVPGPDDLLAEGDFLGLEYKFSRSGTHVATVSHKLFSLVNKYSVDIVAGEDDITILASTIVIDMVRSDSRS